MFATSLPILAVTLLASPAQGGDCVSSPEPVIEALSSTLVTVSAGPDLPNTPSPTTFADAWALRFEEAVRLAAGRDERLSRSEAYRLGELDGWEALFADDARAVLFPTGQETMSVSKLVEIGRERALKSAKSAAGSDGRLSLPDGENKLYKRLRKDFLWLRGKLPIPPSRTREELAAIAEPLVLEAIDAGTAVKLPGPPPYAAGRKPIIERLEHPASNTWGDVFLVEGRIYWSRAASAGPSAALVGWYDIGPMPPPAVPES